MQAKVLWALGIICVGIMVFCITFLMEQHEVTEWTGQSEKATRNPFLAAERFLEKRGVEVVKTTDVIDFQTIPIDQTVLLTEVDGMLVSPRQVEAAVDWVKRGGYLIAGVGKEIQGQTSILKRFDIEPEYLEVDIEDIFLDKDGNSKTASERLREVNKKIEERQAKRDAEAAKKTAEGDVESSDLGANDSPTDEGDKPKSVDADDEFNQQLLDLLNPEYDHEYFKLNVAGDDDLFIAVLDRIVLNHYLLYDYDDERGYSASDYKLRAWSSDENGERLLQIDYGEGSLVAISSSDLWENEHIGMGDHAYFLSYLVPDDSTLQLFYNVQSPPLLQIVYKYFYEMIWAAVLLLALWLWHRGIRIQRITPNEDGGRRNFAEHLRSSAEFLTRNNQFSTLVHPIKHDIELQLRAQHPNFSQLNDATQVAILSDKTDLSKPAIESWLEYCRNIDNREQLFAALQLGNAIRKQL